MSKKGDPAPPTPPDPTVVANAQSAANIASATAQQKLNLINTSGPGGTVNYSADANAPGGYSQTTTLSPSQQAIYDQGTQAQSGALGIANTQLGRVGTALGQGLDPSGVQTSFDAGNPLQTSFDPGQAVQGQAGYQNINQSVNQNEAGVFAQAMSRLAPQQALQNEQSDTQLANQGLGVNSTAYQNAKDILGRQQNDATNQAIYSAIGSGQNEQNTLMNQQLNQGTFANQAAGQEYAQNQGQAAFNNTAAAQQFGQNQAQAVFGNQANAQQFAQNAQAQELPINEFNSLMSSSQVASPQGVQYTPSQVSPTDVTGAYALNSQAAQANYANQLKNSQSTMGGLFNLGSSALSAAGNAGGFSALMGSDIRLKKDIRRVGALDDGTPVYSYRYKSGGPPMIGVMAHELAKTRPELVHDVGGYLAVSYGGL